MSGIIVHEWLAPLGGSENVFATLIEAFPDAQTICLWNDDPLRFPMTRETWLARTPLRGHKALALPIMPLAWRDLEFTEGEWLLCSSHCFAHHARLRGVGADLPKFVYAHTPARYLWAPELDERGGSLPVRALAGILKPLDKHRAAEATSIAANSRFVAERVRVAWDREATVIHPPVAARFFAQPPMEFTSEVEEILENLPSQYLLGASRFVPYKRLDYVIRAGAAADLPVVLAGDGPDEPRLRAAAEASSSPVTFVSRPSTVLLRELYRRALAYVFPPIEDFGIMPVEAMATGVPAIVNSVGGAAESVLDQETGVHVHEWTPTELRRAVEITAAIPRSACTNRALEFDADCFKDKVHAWLDSYRS